MARVAPNGISVKVQGDNFERFISYSNVSGQNIVDFNAPNDSLVRNYVVQITLLGGLTVSSNFQLGCLAPVPVPVVPIPIPAPVAPTPTPVPSAPVPVGPTPAPAPAPAPAPPTPVVPTPQPVPTPTTMPPPPQPTPQPVPNPVPQPVVPNPEPTPVPVPQPIPTPTMPPPPDPVPNPIPVPVVSSRAILLSNPTSTTNEEACGVGSGLTKYILSSFVITNGLEIFNDPGLTIRTYTSNPGNISTIIDGANKFAVTFDSNGVVSTVTDCASVPVPSPVAPVPNPIPVPIASKEMNISSEEYVSSAEACLAITATIPVYTTQGTAITSGVKLWANSSMNTDFVPSSTTAWFLLVDGGIRYAVQVASNGFISSAIPC